MSDVIVSVVESTTNVTVTEPTVAVDVAETNVQVSASTAGLQGASYAPGDPVYVTVRNATGATLPKGTIVYTSGANGTHTLVSPALANADATSARTLGWLAQSLANNQDGLCQVEGYLDGINTQGITEGAQLYLSTTVAGGFQQTKPQAPDHIVYVGVAAKASAGNGRVYIKCQNGYELDEIHDVQIINKTDGDVLEYDSATGVWKNRSLTAAGIAQLVGGNSFSGAQVIQTNGTANIGLIVQGTASQSADLLQVRSSTGSTAVGVTSNNNLYVSGNGMFGTVTPLARLTSVVFTPSVVGMVIRGASSQTADLLQIQNSSGGTVTAIDSTGQVMAYNGVRSNSIVNTTTFNNSRIQTSNTGTIIDTGIFNNPALRVQNTSSTATANIQEWLSSAGGTVARVATTGQILGNSFVSSVFQITSGGIFSNGAQSAPANTQAYFLTTSATNAGLVVRGAASQSANLQEWQVDGGTVRAFVNNLGRVGIRTSSLLNGAESLAVAAVNPTDPGIVVRGAASQSANLQEWQTSSGTVSVIDSVGRFNSTTAGNFGGLTAGLAFLGVQTQATTIGQLIRAGSQQTASLVAYQDSAAVTLGGRNANAQIFSGTTAPIARSLASGIAISGATGNGTTATITISSGHGLAVADRVTISGITSTSGNYNGTFSLTAVTATTISYANTATGTYTGGGTIVVDSQASIVAKSAATTGLVVRGATSQTVNLQEWQNDTGTLLGFMGNGGAFRAVIVQSDSANVDLRTANSGGQITMLRQTAAATNPGANYARLYLRDGTNAGTLKLVVRAGAAGAETTILDNIPQ